MEKIERQKEITERLNAAAKAYYSGNGELMTNYEYDALYDELVLLEKETGTVLAGSPTAFVGYEPSDKLPRERHAEPMLSLGKTKNRDELKEWLGDKEGILSWKEDGLTVVLTYEKGELVKAVTRGNGETGEVITANARTFKNIPLSIPYDGSLIVRGEAVIGYKDFEKINEENPETDASYKNPRNLCSGSVRALDPKITASRNVRIIIFALVKATDTDGKEHDTGNSFEKSFIFLKSLGFETVEYERVNAGNIKDAIARFEERIKDNDIPSDGLVLSYDDLAYAASLGRTAKFPRGAIAFKWADETAETVLRSVEWQTSRTGLINPVAVFDPVDLEGTEVKRASVHNISVIKELKLGIGDRIKVYKANMIIPQISEDITASGSLAIPERCPVCGAPAVIEKAVDSEVLMCTGTECPAKKVKSFVHFASREAMNIEGLSDMTLEKFIAAGLLHELPDIYALKDKREGILGLEGFKEKSVNNILESIERSRECECSRFITALGIAGIGLSAARLICDEFSSDMEKIMNAKEEELSSIAGIGPVLAAAFYSFMHEPANIETVKALTKELKIKKSEKTDGDERLKGYSFVITGSLVHFDNREELKAVIERLGGKVSGSVSAKTECLINNDAASSSNKNMKAKELGVKILTEDEFLSTYLEGIGLL